MAPKRRNIDKEYATTVAHSFIKLAMHLAAYGSVKHPDVEAHLKKSARKMTLLLSQEEMEVVGINGYLSDWMTEDMARDIFHGREPDIPDLRPGARPIIAEAKPKPSPKARSKARRSSFNKERDDFIAGNRAFIWRELDRRWPNVSGREARWKKFQNLASELFKDHRKRLEKDELSGSKAALLGTLADMAVSPDKKESHCARTVIAKCFKHLVPLDKKGHGPILCF